MRINPFFQNKVDQFEDKNRRQNEISSSNPSSSVRRNLLKEELRAPGCAHKRIFGRNRPANPLARCDLIKKRGRRKYSLQSVSFHFDHRSIPKMRLRLRPGYHSPNISRFRLAETPPLSRYRKNDIYLRTISHQHGRNSLVPAPSATL